MRLTTISLRPKYKWGRRTPHSAPGYSSCSPSCGRPGGSRCLPGLPWAPLQTAAKPPPEPARPHPLPGCSLPRGGGEDFCSAPISQNSYSSLGSKRSTGRLLGSAIPAAEAARREPSHHLAPPSRGHRFPKRSCRHARIHVRPVGQTDGLPLMPPFDGWTDTLPHMLAAKKRQSRNFQTSSDTIPDPKFSSPHHTAFL